MNFRNTSTFLLFSFILFLFHGNHPKPLYANDQSSTLTVSPSLNPPSVSKKIAAALEMHEGRTTILFEEGKYYLDNPIHINRDAVHIEGKNDTVIYPKNPGMPFFVIEADYVTMANLQIDAKNPKHNGRATFAIQIGKGHSHIRILQTKILNSGATSILAPSVTDSLFVSNVIINSGDDAMQLRGHRLTLTNNVIVRYFDEAIDVGNGDDIMILDNYLAKGRIGIVVDGAKRAVISGNIVVDHLQQGIVLASKAGGVVTDNIVYKARGSAYNLYSPMLVSNNIVRGNTNIGFNLYNATGSIVKNNHIEKTDFGIKAFNVSETMFSLNDFSGTSANALIFDNTNHNNIVYPASELSQSIQNNKRYELLRSVVSPGSRYAHQVSIFPSESIEKFFILENLSEHLSGEIDPEIRGESGQDIEVARKVENLLHYHNPGFLSIRVDGATMRSEITPDLYSILKGSGQLGIGVVRMPFLTFKGKSKAYFPLWHLSVDGREMIVVCRKYSGPKVRVLFKENGELSVMDRLSLGISRLTARIHHILVK